MNQSKRQIEAFFKEFLPGCQNIHEAVTVGVAPQFPHISLLKNLKGTTRLVLGSQDVSPYPLGAYTGDVAAETLQDLGCTFTIVGHSERRKYYEESSTLLKNKIKISLEHKLKVIFCLGETLEEREGKKTLKIVKDQLLEVLQGFSSQELEQIMIAYEPVWAIGTGVTATASQAQEVHEALKELITTHLAKDLDIPILYGGSAKPSNAEELLKVSSIDGLLVGGASLKAQDFLSLCKIASSML